MVFQNDILAGASGADGGYEIDQSIRFNDNDSAYLSRTSGATGDRQKWTFSAWVKRGNLSSNQRLFHDSGNTNFIMFGYSSNNEFRVYLGADIRTTALFRDPSAWYHLVVAVDTTQATSSDRVKIYQNGVQITSFSTAGYPSLNYNTIFNNSGTTYQISGQSVSEYFDGYISEFHWIDGQALAPTDFGETNDDGVWIPKAYAGTYGTNGFYITGADSADLGADYSGNGNDFTSSGLTSDDQVTDTPTDNYATWNSLDRTSNATPSDGNLRYGVGAGVGYVSSRSTIALPSSGKFYWEITHTSNGASPTAYYGVASSAASLALNTITAGEIRAVYTINGNKYDGSTSSTYGAAIPTSNVVGVAVDMDAGTIKFASNNQWSNGAGSFNQTYDSGTAAYTDLLSSGKNWFAYLYIVQAFGDVNFGQKSFTYTPPTGFSALSTANLPAPTIKDGSTAFQTTLYTGDGSSTQTITQSENSTFNPDFIWIKNRSNAYSHNINDAVRGYTGASPATAADVKVLAADATDKEGLGDTITTAQQRGFVQSSTSNGFIVNKGTSGSQDGFYTNASGHTYAAWQWLAANGTASNTDGSITSTVSANTTAGFSVLTFAGSGGTGTVGHGLSQSPNFIIVKSRDTVNAWYTGSDFYTTWEYYQTLNSTAAQAAGSTVWNSTAPTSSVFSIGASLNTSAEDYVAYCFHEVEGFSKFGKYTGNGSTDGPFVWCGFSPAFVIIKCSSVANSWTMYDTTRQPYNANGRYILAESSAAEVASTTVEIDILSNGFKARDNQNNINGSGRTYIYMAFAEHPFGGDGVAPVPAR